MTSWRSVSEVRLTVIRSMILIAPAAAASFAGPAKAEEKEIQPNIVLFFIDDMGWRDWSGGGSDYLETPSIDRIGREGIVFTNGYVNAANCGPSRCCLLSGQYTPRTNYYNVVSIHRGKKSIDRLSLRDVTDRQVLADEKVSFAEAMKKAGYKTAMYGKWHVFGRDRKNRMTPDLQGFDDSQANSPQELGAFFRSSNHSDPKNVYGYTNRAIRFAEKCIAEQEPFLIYLAHHAVHGPDVYTQDAFALYENKTPGEINYKPAYGAMMHDTDKSIGVMLDKLDSLGIADNTVVIFLSDNGGVPGHCTQPPLRAFKGSYYDGGIRVPFMIRWPGKIKAGVCSTPVMAIDLYPTMLELAGVEDLPQHLDNYPIDGTSLMPLLTGGELSPRSLFWHFPGYLAGNPSYTGTRTPNYRAEPVSVIRNSAWKLHLFMEEWSLDGGRENVATNNSVELYNLRDDPGEATNLAQEDTAKRDEMLDELLAWHDKIGAVIPREPNPHRKAGSVTGDETKNGRSSTQNSEKR